MLEQVSKFCLESCGVLHCMLLTLPARPSVLALDSSALRMRSRSVFAGCAGFVLPLWPEGGGAYMRGLLLWCARSIRAK